jgi:hypothetical protein
MINASWSPVDPGLLAFAWIDPYSGSAPYYEAIILDLDAGPVFTAPESWSAVWSPDGNWVAFSGQGHVTTVDREGQIRFALQTEPNVWCDDVAWNPMADLSGLAKMPGRTFRFNNTHREP